MQSVDRDRGSEVTVDTIWFQLRFADRRHENIIESLVIVPAVEWLKN